MFVSGKKKILIIEDNLIFANDFAETFENNGFDTLHVDNIDDGIAILQTVHIDGISLDVQIKGALGINLIRKIDDFEHKPVIIVVSSFVNPDILRTLKQNRILHYDKSASGFNFRMVVDSFASFLLDIAPLKSSVILATNENLRKIIRKKLESYNINVRAVAFDRLVKGIYYTILPIDLQKMTLSEIYENVVGVEYHTAFISMKRLLYDTFANATVIPTPKDFIYQIVAEIEQDFPDL